MEGIYVQDGIGYLPTLDMTLQPQSPWRAPTAIHNENPSHAIPDPALALDTLPAVVEPDSYLHQPQLPDIPLPPDTRSYQEAEMVRPLSLLAMIGYGSNDTTALLDPSLEDFYVGVAHPAPASAIDTAAKSIQQLLSLYESGNSWQTDLRPQPQVHDNPLAILSTVQPLIQRPLQQPLIWCWNSDLSPLQPDIPSIDTAFAAYNLEADISQALVPIQPQFAFMPYEAPMVDPVAWLAEQGSSQPDLDVLPTVTTQLEQAAADISGAMP